MPDKINWSFNVEVLEGPKVFDSQTIDVEAYDKVEVVIDAGASDLEVTVQPGGEGQVKFLMIRSSLYGEDLTYKVNSNTTVIELDAPQLLLGKGAVKLLDSAPASLLFTNNTAENVTIQILVGRDATPG